MSTFFKPRARFFRMNPFSLMIPVRSRRGTRISGTGRTPSVGRSGLMMMIVVELTLRSA